MLKPGPRTPLTIRSSNATPHTAANIESPSGADIEQRQPPGDHPAHSFGDADPGELGSRQPDPGTGPHERHVLEMSEYGLQEEWVAVGLAAELLAQLVGWTTTGVQRHELGDGAVVEAIELNDLDRATTYEIPQQRASVLSGLAWASSGHDHRSRDCPTGDVSEQEQRRRFGPLQVVDHQQQRPLGSDGSHQLDNGFEQTPPLVVRISPRRARPQRHPRCQLRPQLGELCATFTDNPLQGRIGTTCQPRAERFDDRLIWRRQTFLTASVHH